MSQTDDPWAKWRKPAAEADGKPTKKAPQKVVDKKTADKAAPRPAAAAQTETAPPAPAPTSGRLGIARSVASAEGAARKRPVRGGALTRRPKPAALAENAGETAARPASSGQDEERSREKRGPLNPRTDGAKSSRQNTPADRVPGKKPAVAFGNKAASDSKPAAREKVRPGKGKAAMGKTPANAFAPTKERLPAAKQLLVATPAPAGVRLSKIMVERGLASRREADLWIERGWVWVDGARISQLGARIAPDAQVEVRQDAGQTTASREVTFLLHKPAGYSCERGALARRRS